MAGTAVTLNHQFVSAKADGPDTTLVRASNWNALLAFTAGADGQKLIRDSSQSPAGASWIDAETCSLTNKTGSAAAVGDVVALSTANDSSVVLDDTQGSLNKFVVALQTPADAAAGAYAKSGPVAGVKATGAISRGNYVRKSATTKTVEDTGISRAATTAPPPGALGVALTAAAAGVVTILLFDETVQPTLGGYMIRGLVGANNATTPNTKYDLTSADLVQLRNPTDGSIIVKTAVGLFTNDTGLAGSAINGRDQAGAFSASSWIHFYYACKADGTGLGSLSSATAPPTGPTLPTGYTHWAYAGAIRFDGSSHLLATRMRGAWMTYDATQAALSGGAATTETSVSTSTLVPPNALSYTMNGGLGVTGNSAGDTTATPKVRLVTAVEWWQSAWTLQGFGGAHNFGYALPDLTVPNIGQAFLYLWVLAAGASSPNMTLNVTRYSVPNGAE